MTSHEVLSPVSANGKAPIVGWVCINLNPADAKSVTTSSCLSEQLLPLIWIRLQHLSCAPSVTLMSGYLAVLLDLCALVAMDLPISCVLLKRTRVRSTTLYRASMFAPPVLHVPPLSAHVTSWTPSRRGCRRPWRSSPLRMLHAQAPPIAAFWNQCWRFLTPHLVSVFHIFHDLMKYKQPG